MAPSKEGSKMEGQGMVFMKTYYDGKAGATTNMQTGKKDLTAEEIAAKQKSVGLIPEINYAKSGMTTELLGIEENNGTKVYVLKLTDGSTETFDYFDTQTFMKVKSLSIRKEGEEVIESTSTYGDFKEVNGVLFPHVVNTSMGEMAFSGKVTSIVINGKIDMEVFK
jgi:hypothetical protein